MASPQQDREAAFWDHRSGGREQQSLLTEHDVLGREPLFVFLEQQVRERQPPRLLDAGCGAGVGTARLASYSEKVTGIDVSPRSLEVAAAWSRERGRANTEFTLSPVERLPFADHSFEMIVGYFVLHHLEDLAAGAAELRRVLAPGGRAFFAESWGRNPLLTGGRELADRLGMRHGTEDESPLRPAQLEILGSAFSEVRLHYPSLDFFKYAHQPLLKLKKLFPKSRVVGRAIDLLWPLPLALDGWVWSKFPKLRPWGWHVVVELGEE